MPDEQGRVQSDLAADPTGRRRRARPAAVQPGLLCEFTERCDEAALRALLCRHGPMILSVCRNVQGSEADAEDVFQATCLVLFRKAASARKTASVGSWLHGVAYRTALKARAQAVAREMGRLPFLSRSLYRDQSGDDPRIKANCQISTRISASG